jgi:hypothetical protein
LQKPIGGRSKIDLGALGASILFLGVTGALAATKYTRTFTTKIQFVFIRNKEESTKLWLKLYVLETGFLS